MVESLSSNNNQSFQITEENKIIFKNMREYEWLCQSDPDPWKNPHITDSKKNTVWTPYDQAKVYILEKALLNNEPTCKILNLIIDLKKMVQVNEQESGNVKERPIIRVPRGKQIAMSRVRQDRVQHIDLVFLDPDMNFRPDSPQITQTQSLVQQQKEEEERKQEQTSKNIQENYQDGDKEIQYIEEFSNLKITHYFSKSTAEVIDLNNKTYIYDQEYIKDQRHSILPNRSKSISDCKTFLDFLKRNPFQYKHIPKISIYDNTLIKNEENDFILPEFILKANKQLLLRQFTNRAIQLLGYDESGNKKSDFTQQDLTNLICEGIIAHGKELDKEMGFSWNDQVGLVIYNDLMEAPQEKFHDVLMRQYTEECFLYKDINKMLREQSNQDEEVFAKRFRNLFPYYLFFLQAQQYSLHKSIKANIFTDASMRKKFLEQQERPNSLQVFLNSKNDYKIQLYRGATLPEKLIAELKKNHKKLIRFNEILSTTFDKTKALQFATNALFSFTILKDIDKKNYGVYQTGQKAQSYQFDDYRWIAKYALAVENITAVKGEQEVIFPSGIIVQIDKVEKRNNINEIAMSIALQQKQQIKK